MDLFPQSLLGIILSYWQNIDSPKLKYHIYCFTIIILNYISNCQSYSAGLVKSYSVNNSKNTCWSALFSGSFCSFWSSASILYTGVSLSNLAVSSWGKKSKKHSQMTPLHAELLTAGHIVHNLVDKSVSVCLTFYHQNMWTTFELVI